MLAAIKIGNQYVPILDTYESTHGPAGTLPYQIPNNEKPTYNGSAMEYYNGQFRQSCVIRNCLVSNNDGAYAVTDDIKLLGGNTDLHGGVGGASFYLENPVLPSPSSYPISEARWAGRWMTGTNTDYTFNNAVIASGYPNWPSSGTTWDRQAKIFAVRIKYTSNPGYFNYILYKLERHREIKSTGESATYNMTPIMQLNMNYWRRNGIEAYYEEDEIPDEEDPTDEGEPSDEDGGDGEHEKDYDPIPLPPSPTQGAATAGFITLYKLHQASMVQFASDMFASSLWEALKQFFGTPMDFLVGVNLLPFEPTAGPSFKPAYGPTAVFGHAYPTVANQYVDIDCGSVEVKKYWGSCFDFEPYTKIQIWLPYIGYRDLPVDEVMGMTISVKYRCDCLTGDCVAFVFTGVVGETGPQVERVIAQFYGNCAVRVPFGATSYDSAISNSIALMGAAATAGLSAGAGAISEGAKIGAGLNAGVNAAGKELATNSASVGVVQGLKPNVHKGGAAGAATGYMSIQVPYLIRRIPRQNLPDGYMQLKGYPSNIGGKLADFTGLAVVDDIQLNDIPALETEREEIINWLRGGVII